MVSNQQGREWTLLKIMCFLLLLCQRHNSNTKGAFKCLADIVHISPCSFSSNIGLRYKKYQFCGFKSPVIHELIKQ